MSGPDSPLELLYRDEHYAAVHKPPGLLVHRSWLSQDERYLLQMVRNRLRRRVYPVHRLDRATSGVIVFGLTPEAAERLHTAFEQHQVEKRYRAVVRGWVEGEGLIDHPLEDRETGVSPRPALTRYRSLARVELPVAVDRYLSARYSLLEVRPETGRRHQIRKHLKHIHHPIVGDTTYGKGTHNRFFRERFGFHRLLLTARALAFSHPYTGRPMRIEAAPESDWQALMAALGWAGI